MVFSRVAIPRQGFWAKLFRYGLSSGLALAVDVGLLFLLVQYTDIHYLTAAAIGFASGCLLIWLLSVAVVFDNHSDRLARNNLLLFLLIGLLGLALNHLILYVGVDLIGIALLLAKACSAIIVFWFNFFLRGALVFKDPDMFRQKQDS